MRSAREVRHCERSEAKKSLKHDKELFENRLEKPSEK